MTRADNRLHPEPGLFAIFILTAIALGGIGGAILFVLGF